MTPPSFRTALPAQRWPAHLAGQPARTLAFLHQLDASQWWTPQALHDAQFRQLHALLAHAARHAPFHRPRLRAAGFDPARPLDPATWARIPILTRHDIQAHGPRLRSTVVPPEHGAIQHKASGGSTGIPVRIRVTDAQMLLLGAALCRDYAWHNDPAAPAARIRSIQADLPPDLLARAQSPDGVDSPSHGLPYDEVWHTGPSHFLDYQRSPAEQAAFLQRTRPTHLNLMPSTLRLLLHHLRDHAIALPTIRVVSCTSETVDPPLRALCHSVLGCRITDAYSANETGLMASRCPSHEAYHVCAETCLVEVLDDEGNPCVPGQVGRVVVTPLHGFAMPLLRYEVGDRAEPGPPCPCGRGLPVLARIAGRTYDTLLHTDGTRRTLGAAYEVAEIAPIREFQLAQTVPGAVELRIVATRRLTADEAAHAVKSIRTRAGPGIAISIAYRDRLPRTAAGKLRMFVSELPS